MRCALVAIICFIIGGLIGSGLTYQFGRCKTSEIIFRLQTPKAVHQNTSDVISKRD